MSEDKIFWWFDKWITKEELAKNLGFDSETIDGDYREGIQAWNHKFSNPEIIDKRFMSDNSTIKDAKDL